MFTIYINFKIIYPQFADWHHFKFKYKNRQHFTISSLQEQLSIHVYKYLCH